MLRHNDNDSDVHGIPGARGGTGRRAATAAAGIALVLGCVPLAFADTGGNDKNFVKHLAVDCPQPYSQTCPPRDGITFDSSTDSSDWVNFFFRADNNPPACAPGLATLYVDGNPVGPAQLLQPGGATKAQYMHLPLGPHAVEVQMAGALGGCNTGAMSGWSGTLAVNTDQPSTTTPMRPPPPGGQPGQPQGPQPGDGFIPPH
jgi:hypothetical protein